MKIDLVDPASYLTGQPWDQYAWLQEHAPMYWHDLPGDDIGFYAITRYEDVKALERDFTTFCNEPNATVFDANTFGDENHNSLLFTDPPRHTAHRKFIGKELVPNSVKNFANHVDSAVNDIINEVIEKGECDLVTDIGGKLASYVTADLMGLPRDLLVEFYELTEVMVNSKSATEGPGAEAAQKLFAHSMEIYEDRKANPRDDLVTRLAVADGSGFPADAQQFFFDVTLFINAGGDTTRNVMAGGMQALFENPDQLAKLQADDSLIPSAVEEMLRWVTPITSQARRATCDTEFLGQKLKKGTKLASFYGAANRDPREFENPNQFDVARSPNAHIAFGHGPHRCLGLHLARQELVIMLRQVLRRMPDIEPTGPAVWGLPAEVLPLIVGPKSIPAKFTPGPKVAVA